MIDDSMHHATKHDIFEKLAGWLIPPRSADNAMSERSALPFQSEKRTPTNEIALMCKNKVSSMKELRDRSTASTVLSSIPVSRIVLFRLQCLYHMHYSVLSFHDQGH